MIKCKVCKTELTADYYCPYCGYDAASLTSDADYSEEYKTEILQKLKDITISADTYKYNETKNSFEKIGSKSLFSAGIDGIRCSKSIVKSDEWIAHFDGEAELTVTYVFGGRKKTVKAKIAPGDHEGIWYLGLRINENLRLEIGLCVVPVDGKASPKSYLLNSAELDLIT